MENSFKILISFLLCLPVVTLSNGAIFNVIDFGAIGNGVADDTNAFEKAWTKTCSSPSSPVMKVPSNKKFLIQPLRFTGPCKSDPIILVIDGNLVAPSDPSKWKCDDNACHQLIYFHRVDGLMLRGRGTIDGHGQKWWENKHLRRPVIMEISDSNNVKVGGALKFKDSPDKNLVLNGLRSLSVSNLTITAPGDSPNTDGILLQKTTNAHIHHCKIRTGDDCIALLHGSSNVTINNIICGPGHGISIGSLGRNGDKAEVEDIKVSNVVFIGTTNGARIKTWQGGSGYARNIHFERCLFRNADNPITIDQFYCDRQNCRPSELAVAISNVSYKMMIGSTRGKNAVELKCSDAIPCRDIVMEDLHIVTADGAAANSDCNSVYGRAQGHQIPKISCLK